MNLRRKSSLNYLMATLFAFFVLNGICTGQTTISITGSSSLQQAPTTPFTVTATFDNVANVKEIVFYRNDVPYKTFSQPTSPLVLNENNPLGQDIYNYRAKVFEYDGDTFESNDFTLSVETRRVLWMGPNPSTTPPPAPNPSPIPTSTPPDLTNWGPGRTKNHTVKIQEAVNWLSNNGGGTLYFPCRGDGDDVQSIYNISETINVPQNVTLQGESSEEATGSFGARCRIYWNNQIGSLSMACRSEATRDPNLSNKAMFRLQGNSSRVRFKDLFLYSRTLGRDCFTGSLNPDKHRSWVETDNTTAIGLYGTDGSISDVILENVSITDFTYGIKATTCTNPDSVNSDYNLPSGETPVPCTETENVIKDIKIRGYRPVHNFRQLYINAKYTYDWDIQNVNVSYMALGQGAVEIMKAGVPSGYNESNRKIKFLQLNCNGNTNRTPAFCARVKKHSGLYFKGLHHEGTNESIIVEDISETNPDEIVFEGSVATGQFKDESMKLYLIGNSVFTAPEIPASNLDQGRMRFIGNGKNSTLVDCGDVHWDITDINGGIANWWELQMMFSHTERNRESFLAEQSELGGNPSYPKPHTVCPANINNFGGEYFNSGVMPSETYLPYTYVFDGANCSASNDPTDNCADLLQNKFVNTGPGGAIKIVGKVYLNKVVFIRSGKQIIGAPDSEIILTQTPFVPIPDRLFTIKADSAERISSIVIRNLKMKTSLAGKTGLAIIGSNVPALVGVTSDMHFSGLDFEGFGKGLEVNRDESVSNTDYPMVDGVSWKKIGFKNNQTGAYIYSWNLSNWNVMNLSFQSTSANALGWYQKFSGNSMQNISCQGASDNYMEHCLKLDMSGIFLTGFKQPEFVNNAVTFGENIPINSAPFTERQFASSVLRDNDFRPKSSANGAVKINGRSFIVSINNKYQNFNVVQDIYEGHLSRITYCGDAFVNLTPFPSLSPTHPNRYVGVPTSTLIKCGEDPKPWSDVVRFDEDKHRNIPVSTNDIPFVGKFSDDVNEDLVLYHEATPSTFRMMNADGTNYRVYQWGMTGDIPLVGKFKPGTKSQIAVFRPSNGQWWIYDPVTNDYLLWWWGTNGDIPFVGNFIDESTHIDELGVYRPSNGMVYIYQTATGNYKEISIGTGYLSTTVTGDFITVGNFIDSIGYEQPAFYKDGTWKIYNAPADSISTQSFGLSGDVPFAGKFLTGNCSQLGVWSPNLEEMKIQDPAGCGGRNASLVWGSNNSNVRYDIPLQIKTQGYSVARPVAYRPTNGALTNDIPENSIAKGQWWIHYPFKVN